MDRAVRVGMPALARQVRRPASFRHTLYLPRMLRRTLLLLALLPVACRANRVAPPRANFLIMAGDSTFWIRSGAQGVHARGSPILLGRYGGKFYEVYVVDDDHS